MKKTIFLIGSVGLILSACASTPDPEPVIVAETPAPIAAPIPVEPRPLPPVQSAPAPVIQESIAPVVTLNPHIPGSADDFLYQSGGEARVYFGYDQYTLSGEARDSLRAQANWLNLYPTVTAVIEGNADERGTREYNLALGARRADSVKTFLVSQGVSPSRLTTVSYGKERPIDGHSSENAWSRNRNGHTNLISGTIG